MKLKSMKCGEEKKPSMISSVEADKPMYPYGLQIRLDKEQLEKLELGMMPEVGEEVLVMAMAKVTSVSIREGEEEKHKCVELQITDMAVKMEKSMEESFYGKA